MRRYLLVVTALVALSVPAFLGLVALGSGLVLNMAYDKVAVRLKDKMALADSRPGRRILAFGGSSAFFDFRGADIEALTGLASINVGTHSGNGTAFLIWQAESLARPGDIVIMALEDGYYREPGVTYYGANVSLILGGDFFGSLSLADRIVYLRNIHVRRLLKVAGARLGLSDYALGEDWTYPINVNGDMEAPSPPAAQVSGLIAEVSGERASAYRVDPRALERIADFVARMKERGVTVLFTLPGVMENGAPGERQVAALKARLEAAGAAFLELPERGAIPAEMMFDTIYHAARPGAELYTAQLATALCADADALDFRCDKDRLAATNRLREAAAERGYLFGAPDALASLQPDGDGSPAALEPGAAVSFMVASLEGCRERLELTARGEGRLGVRIAGRAVEEIALEGGRTTATRPLPNVPGLVEVELTAAPGSDIRLIGAKRIGRCRG